MKSIEKFCEVCQRIFYVYPYRKQTAKFCSYTCFHISRENIPPWNIGLNKEDPRVRELSRKSGLTQRGRKHSEETLKKMRIAHKNTHPSKEALENSLKNRIGKKLSLEHRKKLSLAKIGKSNLFWKGRKHSEVSRKKQSETRKALLKNNPELLKKLLTFRLPNKGEKFLQSILNSENLPYKYVGNGDYVIAGKNPDFININGQKKIIELAGETWHTLKQMEERSRLFKNYGYETLIIWYLELKKPWFVRDKLRRFEYESSYKLD